MYPGATALYPHNIGEQYSRETGESTTNSLAEKPNYAGGALAGRGGVADSNPATKDAQQKKRERDTPNVSSGFEKQLQRTVDCDCRVTHSPRQFAASNGFKQECEQGISLLSPCRNGGLRGGAVGIGLSTDARAVS